MNQFNKDDIISDIFNEKFLMMRSDHYKKLIKWIIENNIKTPNSYLALGFAYTVSNCGLDKDLNMAKTYYKKAYYLGHPNAAYRLGSLIVEEYPIEAIEYLIYACEHKIAPAWALLCLTIEELIKKDKLSELQECMRSNFVSLLKIYKVSELIGSKFDSLISELQMNYRRMELI